MLDCKDCKKERKSNITTVNNAGPKHITPAANSYWAKSD